ncbi:MAG: hypothetical protein ACRYGI_08855 [Janthinobacterium lividum]
MANELLSPGTGFHAARAALEQATDNPALCTEAHYLLWEVCQACGDRAGALAHLDTAMTRNPLRTRLIPDQTPDRAVLALAVPGDFQANLPLGMLLDGSTLLHTLWLADPDAIIRDPRMAIPIDLPPIDCVFVSIAEDRNHAAALRAADLLARELGVPVINSGERIARLSRTGAARLLDGVAGAVVPGQAMHGGDALRRDPPAFPFIVRPVGRHAGDGLSLIADSEELDAYLGEHTESPEFFTAPFVDYRSRDGMYRKLRVVFVDGVPYPVHLAIHANWAVWYYNAGMELDRWKRDEEGRFLSDIATYAGDRAMSALHEIGSRVGLDYFGLDCAILEDGQLLVFEVETGMIVHDHDPVDLYPDKKRCIPRIFRAVERMIDGRIAGSR